MDDEAQLARRITEERLRRNWSLSDLARQSGVSKSMLSKVERQEASPTATVLLRIASALEMTLAELMIQDPPAPRLMKRAQQAEWTDPASGYRRRQIYLSRTLPLELVEVELPAGAAVAAPSSSYQLIRQVLWVLEGDVVIQEGDQMTALQPGDRLEFGAPADVVFRNLGTAAARYIVAVLRQ